MPWMQKTVTLAPRPRGFHLITSEVVNALPDLNTVEVGLLHLFLQHTSASLSINENADPTVRHDFERFFNQTVPDDTTYFEHTLEGDDDMPAHIKSSVLGVQLSLPVTQGKLGLGIWQGIYLCEHRDHGGPRRLLLTLHADD